MMWQVINIVTNAVLFVEVLYLFSCGQRYMKAQTLRSRRNFHSERWIYLFIGIFSLVNVFLTYEQARSETLLTAAFALLLFRKCVSAARTKTVTKCRS